MDERLINVVVPAIERNEFGCLPDGRAVEAITLSNANGMSACILTYGATIQSWNVPDQCGAETRNTNIVLGYDELTSYLENQLFFGCTIGRYANRISGAGFTLDGQHYQLEANEGSNTLHGGLSGFDRVLWTVASIETDDNPSLTLRYVSKHGEGGFPGELTTLVQFTVTEDDELIINYRARSDRKTVINLTNHSYFNLCGEEQAEGIGGHELQVAADYYLVTDAALIPTGGLASVHNTPLDFNQLDLLQARIEERDHPAIRFGKGIDHAYCLRGGVTEVPRLVATLTEPISGRAIQVLTTQPSLQVYTGNHIAPDVTGKSSQHYQPHHAICLETQHYPDAPNHPHFPTTELEAHEDWQQTTIYRFLNRDPKTESFEVETMTA